MRKIIVLIFAICVLSTALITYSHYKAECLNYGWDDAILTVDGVYCKVNRVELKNPYMLLSNIAERELANQRKSDPRLVPVKSPFHEDNW